MFTYSHVNTPLSQSEHPYYLSLFIKYITSRWLKQRKQSILNNEPTAVTLTIVHETKKTNKLYYARNDPTILSCHISWDSCDVFCPTNVGFCEFASQSLKFNIDREGTHLFVEIRELHGVTLPYHSAGIFIASHYRPPSGHPLSLHLLGDSLRKLFSAASFPWLILGGDLIAVGLTSHVVISMGIPYIPASKPSYKSLTNNYGLPQHVHSPTQPSSGCLLDLAFAKKSPKPALYCYSQMHLQHAQEICKQDNGWSSTSRPWECHWQRCQKGMVIS